MKLYFSGNPQVYGGADPISVLYDVVAPHSPEMSRTYMRSTKVV